MRQTRRSFVERVDFITSFGYGEGGDQRQRLGIRTQGPTLVVTDLCLMRPDPQTKELVVTSIHPGITREQIEQQTGWPVRFAEALEQTPPPTTTELQVLRDLQARAEQAHSAPSTTRTSPARE
jgi:glutaconate CoA-transferase subunit B